MLLFLTCCDQEEEVEGAEEFPGKLVDDGDGGICLIGGVFFFTSVELTLIPGETCFKTMLNTYQVAAIFWFTERYIVIFGGRNFTKPGIIHRH